MKLDEINKIKIIESDEEVNEHLAKGYRIVKIYSVKETTENGEVVKPMFILGLCNVVGGKNGG